MGLNFKSVAAHFCWGLLGLQLWWSSDVMAAPVTSRLIAVPFDSEYLVDSFGFDEGFPGNSCTGISQTRDGYLWFSSFSGLARFNGLEFTLFTAENQPQIPDTRVVNCYVDQHGRLLLGTMQGLAMKLENGWTNLPETHTWGNRELIRNFAEGTNGPLLVTTTRGRVFQVQDNRLNELPGIPGHGGSYCGVDVNGQPIVVRGGFVGYWNGSAWRDFNTIEHVVQKAVGAGQARGGGVWLVMTNQLVLIRNGQVVQEVPLSSAVEGFWQLLEDRLGNVWLPSLEKGLFRISPNGTVKRFGKADGLPNDSGTRSVFEDAQGNLWVGSGVGGVTRFRPARFHSIGTSAGLPDVAITSMAKLKDGRVLFGTYGGGLALLNGNHVEPNLQVSAKFVQTIVRAKNDEIFIGTLYDGLFSLKGDHTQQFNRTQPKIPTSISALFEDSENRLWIGSINSVGYLAAGQYHPLERPSLWQMEAVFFAERKNSAIITANRSSLFQLVKTNDTLALKLWFSLPEASRITSLLVDEQDRIWIGTAKSGLFVFGNGRLCKVPKAVGLPGNNIVSLLESPAHQLWFGCGRTIVQVNSDELWQAASQTNGNPGLHIYNHRDGVGAIDFPDGFQPTSHRDETGRLWFALLRGAAAVDPQNIPAQANAAPVVFESLAYLPAGSNQPVRVDLGTVTTPLVLPPGSRQIQINCALLDFDAPEKNSYRFRLDEKSEDWHDNSGLNFVSFYELSAGKHQLFVQAAGGNGVSSPAKFVAFRVEEYFWHAPWFWLLCSVCLVVLTGALTRWNYERRLRVVQENLRREQHLAELQTRLASVLENTSDFVGFTNAEGRLLYLNQAGRKLLALTPEQAVTTLAAPQLFTDWNTHVVAFTGNQASEIWSGESTLCCSVGQEIPVSQVIISHRHPDGSLDFCSTIVRDISAMKRNERIREALRSFAGALTIALEPVAFGPHGGSGMR